MEADLEQHISHSEIDYDDPEFEEDVPDQPPAPPPKRQHHVTIDMLVKETEIKGSKGRNTQWTATFNFLQKQYDVTCTILQDLPSKVRGLIVYKIKGYNRFNTDFFTEFIIQIGNLKCIGADGNVKEKAQERLVAELRKLFTKR